MLRSVITELLHEAPLSRSIFVFATLFAFIGSLKRKMKGAVLDQQPLLQSATGKLSTTLGAWRSFV
ncbi:MAG TPA: hypothetical protein VHZ95_10690, partial [Polyangiales bacterium]|nr:hypothetical protein [Polyangiales bacterium]